MFIYRLHAHYLLVRAAICSTSHLQEWAGLLHAAPALQQGLCHAVRRLSGDAATAITLDGVVIAKVGHVLSSAAATGEGLYS